MTGPELVEIRHELKWTRARLAEHLGVSPDYIGRLERGTRPISRFIARYMRCLFRVYLLALDFELIEK
jgi:transcriptional regulator with XRE-family HTH domain